MNLAGHIVVAERIERDRPAFWLGAALPDIAGMGRVRLLGTTVDDDLRRGIAFHHASDEAFHSHPWFTDLQRSLRELLLDDGFGRGAARAIAHVGPELFLDGAVLSWDHTAVDRAFAELSARPEALETLVLPEFRAQWVTHRLRASAWRPHDEPHDPHAVARRLQRILQRRPRLAFDADRVEAVADHLYPFERRVASTAADFVDDLADQLRRLVRTDPSSGSDGEHPSRSGSARPSG